MDDMADMGLIKLHAPSIFTCSSQSRIFGSSAFSSDRKRKRFQESSLGVNGRVVGTEKVIIHTMKCDSYL